jgi:hypothetical protein
MAVLLGIALFIWLPFEDTRLNLVLLFSAALVLLFLSRYLLSKHAAHWLAAISQPGSGSLPGVVFYALFGLVAGLAVTPGAILLMVFKIGVHSHPVPDFSIDQVMWVIQRTPAWGLGGLLLGLGIGLFQIARK